MTIEEILAQARHIAGEAGIEVPAELDELPPVQQVSAIKDRITRHVLALHEEMIRHRDAILARAA